SKKSTAFETSASVIFLDTVVLVYAVGEPHPYRESCRDLLTRVSTGQVAATTTPEVIQEFAHVRGRRRPRADASSLSLRFAELLAPLRLTEQEHLRDGLELWASSEHLGAFDAVLAAVALDSKYKTLVSADRGFAGVPGLDHVFPDAEGVASLVR
ncbi:MAG: type II toxin-antitoxin system VapC family toxin, partial [Nocardioidaceae bacterium]